MDGNSWSGQNVIKEDLQSTPGIKGLVTQNSIQNRIDTLLLFINKKANLPLERYKIPKHSDVISKLGPEEPEEEYYLPAGLEQAPLPEVTLHSKQIKPLFKGKLSKECGRCHKIKLKSHFSLSALNCRACNDEVAVLNFDEELSILSILAEDSEDSEEEFIEELDSENELEDYRRNAFNLLKELD